MNPSAANQISLDNALVAPEARLKIRECNRRIKITKPQREATYQVTLDTLKLSPCYPAFLITTRVPEIYMHQFWNTVTKVQDSSSYQFKLDNKRFKVNAEVFRDILQICPKLPDKPFDIPPSTDEEIVSFVYELGYTEILKLYLNWSLITCINPGEHLQLSSIGAFSGKPLDLITLGCQELKFCRGCITARMLILLNSSGKTLHSRSIITSQREPCPILYSQRSSSITSSHKTSTLKYVSKTEEHQVYGALIPKEMINEDILNSTAYQTYYAYASGAKEPKKARKSKIKGSKSSSSSKSTSRSQHKSSGKSAYAEEPSHTVDDSKVKQNQEFNTGNNDEQPDDEAAPEFDWYKKTEQPSTPDPDWNKRQHVDFRLPQNWISDAARAKKSPTSFDELMDTPIDFFAFVMNRINITNPTQNFLVGPAFNLLKGTCKSRTELEYHFEECFKATTERLDWHNPEGKQYPFDLCKPPPLIPNHQGLHVIPFDYFINNDLEYLKGGSLSRKYSTSVTKTKAVTYEVQWIEDMVPNLWSPVKVVYDKHAYWGTSNWGPKRQQFYGFASNRTSTKDVYSRKRIIVVTSLKIMKWPNLKKRTAFTAYSDPQGVIYMDQNNRNRLIRTDELHKFSDGTLNYVRTALYDITLGIRMEYMPKNKWSRLDKRRARVMIQDIDKQLRDERLIRSLEKFVGVREYGEDLRLLERTI
ncbi:hypothetical protein Tco_0591670 [Tanacetum coccineum]